VKALYASNTFELVKMAFMLWLTMHITCLLHCLFHTVVRTKVIKTRMPLISSCHSYGLHISKHLVY
jgi:hypothetical protein